MSRYRRSEDRDSKVYVGELGSSANKSELEEAFRQYGPLKSVWVARHPPGFAFIEYEDARDAEDCVRGLDGRTVCGRRIRVELSTAGGRRRRDRRGARPSPRRGGRMYNKPSDNKCYQCGERGHYARECKRYDRRGRSRKFARSKSGSSSRSNSKRDSRSPSRNRSKSRDRRHTKSKSRSSSSQSKDAKAN